MVFILGFIPVDTKKKFSSQQIWEAEVEEAEKPAVQCIVVAINVRFWIHLVFIVLSFLGNRYPSFIYFIFGLMCNRSIFFIYLFFRNVNQQRLPRYRQVWDQLWTVRATVKASLFPRRTPQSWAVACPGSFKSARERRRNGSGDCDFHQRGPSGPFGSGLGLELETSLLMWTCLLDLDSAAKRM